MEGNLWKCTIPSKSGVFLGLFFLISHLQYRYRLLFAVGLSSTVKDRDEVLHKIEDEQQWHGDILLGDYDDTYKNISLKVVSYFVKER